MKRLLFIDSPEQVIFLHDSGEIRNWDRVVALTASSLACAQSHNMPIEPVANLADTRKLALIDKEMVTSILSLARNLEHYLVKVNPSLLEKEPGFISAQIFTLQYSWSICLTRLFLVQETVKKIQPDEVALFSPVITPWFEGCNYQMEPWLIAVLEWLEKSGLNPAVMPYNLDKPAQKGFPSAWQRLKSLNLTQRLLTFRKRLSSIISYSNDRVEHRALKLVLAGTPEYDWMPFLNYLRAQRSVRCFALPGQSAGGNFWDYEYSSLLISPFSGHRWQIPGQSICNESMSPLMIEDAFCQWENDIKPELLLVGFNFWSALRLQFLAMAKRGPTLIEHTDKVCTAVFNKVKPDALLTFAVPWLASKRLCVLARERNIPVFCYQHGGIYGTHALAKNEVIAPAYVDYFMTYGPGIKSRKDPVLPLQATFVPVGSLRIKSHSPRAKLRPWKKFCILWIAEITYQNTLGGTFQVEDTQRFLLVQKNLLALGKTKNFDLFYRPYPGMIQQDGIAAWLNESKEVSAQIDMKTPLLELIANADLVITENSGGTIWNEVLYLKKPLLLYLDPLQTPLFQYFAQDLAQACVWCRSEVEFNSIISRVAMEGRTALSMWDGKNIKSFLNKYVTGENGVTPANVAKSFYKCLTDYKARSYNQMLCLDKKERSLSIAKKNRGYQPPKRNDYVHEKDYHKFR